MSDCTRKSRNRSNLFFLDHNNDSNIIIVNFASFVSYVVDRDHILCVKLLLKTSILTKSILCLSYICVEFEKRQDFNANLIKNMKNSNQKSKFV